ncbi:MAG TPA: rod shape-determining protein MreD [Thermoleophilaceae bacterium]
MIVTPGAIVRLGVLALVTVLLDISGFSGIHVLGGTADLVPLLVGAVALYGGALAGAGTGFATGLLLDLLLGQSLGLSSLVLTLVGYWVGSYRELRDSGHGLLPLVVGAAASVGYVVGIAIVSFMLETNSSVSVLALRSMLLTIFLNTLIAMPFFILVRRVLRPVLVVDPLERRRRRRTVAGESGPIGLRGLEIGR